MDQKKKSQLIQGYCNGIIFSLFLGIFEYNFKPVNENWTKSQVRLAYAKFIRNQVIFFPPMLALFQITCSYMEGLGYNYPTQLLAAGGVGICYLKSLSFSKFRFHLLDKINTKIKKLENISKLIKIIQSHIILMQVFNDLTIQMNNYEFIYSFHFQQISYGF